MQIPAENSIFGHGPGYCDSLNILPYSATNKIKNNGRDINSNIFRLNPNAKMFEQITFKDILAKDLKVMDSTAASLCKDNKLQLIVFNMNKNGNIVKAVRGEKIGTLVII